MTLKTYPDELDTTIDPVTCQQREYFILSDKERAKGFVRPVRRTYRHVGIRPRFPLRDLTAEETERYSAYGYVKFEAYTEQDSSVVGRFWTQAQLESGCGQTTTMALELAETYARAPGFYGGTFCCHCRAHFDVGKFGEFVWDGTDEKVGT